MTKKHKKTAAFLILLTAILLTQKIFLTLGDRELFGPGQWEKALAHYHRAAVLGNSNAKIKELLLVKFFLGYHCPPHLTGKKESNRQQGILFYPAPHYSLYSPYFKLTLLTSSYFPLLFLEDDSYAEEGVGAKVYHSLLRQTVQSKDPIKRLTGFSYETNRAESYDDSLFVARKYAEEFHQSALFLWLASTVSPSEEYREELREKAANRGISRALMESDLPYINRNRESLSDTVLIPYKTAALRDRDFHAAAALADYYRSDSTLSQENPSLSNSEFWQQELHRIWKPINYRYWYLTGNIRRFLAVVETFPAGYQFSKWIRWKTSDISYNEFLFYLVLALLLFYEIFISGKKRISRLIKWIFIPQRSVIAETPGPGRRTVTRRGKRRITIRPRKPQE